MEKNLAFENFWFWVFGRLQYFVTYFVGCLVCGGVIWLDEVTGRTAEGRDEIEEADLGVAPARKFFNFPQGHKKKPSHTLSRMTGLCRGEREREREPSHTAQ